MIDIKENVKQITDKNVSDRYIENATELATYDLEEIVGIKLLEALERGTYSALLEKYVKPYLSYRAAYYLVNITSTKVRNVGANVTGDDKVTVERVSEKANFYRHQADRLCYRLQNYLRQHSSDYPELSKSGGKNLYSATSTQLWLGGPRAYRYPGLCGYKVDKVLGLSGDFNLDFNLDFFVNPL